ncbi:response regulator receiver protein [Rubidibacter lacunae KORDI 51-2]|uniref:Response regulator receiver protein n=1 Tax=Rubidibacter lacunae KORDI 51-2 TaxID=582515 RepID=U5DE54_9CHRO|nr:response regulator transcription factor [Rubidibacter lacunae]ERN39901.1 response regulator receiver protein [Rubidibacter lacunae KORDI 51-2]
MPLTVLVADDDPGIRLAVRDYLELQGYAVVAVPDGQAALDAIASHHPQLLVTDIAMPRLDGYRLVRQLRLRPELRLLPVILLTQRDSTQDRIRGYQVGCDVYLPKPFELDELGAIVRNLLERSQIVESEVRFSSSRSASEIGRSNTDNFDFTAREGQVLALIADGLSNADIGQHLHLSPRTIEKHVSRLLRKTDTTNRSELLRFALKHGLAD